MFLPISLNKNCNSILKSKHVKYWAEKNANISKLKKTFLTATNLIYPYEKILYCYCDAPPQKAIIFCFGG